MVSNRLDKVFASKKKLKSIFFTAGFPLIDSTNKILELLQEEEIDFVEIGFPFSDPVADGGVIQSSSLAALKNGMTLDRLLISLEKVRDKITIPLVLMGYLNPVEQYGYDRFAKKCAEISIDGLILPDLPLDLFRSKYKTLFNQHNIHSILLVTPTTSDERVREIDELSTSFIYAVSSAAVTGGSVSLDAAKIAYFERIQKLKLKSPICIGFGIDSKDSLQQVYKYADAAIVGSAFLRSINNSQNYIQEGRSFLKSLTF